MAALILAALGLVAITVVIHGVGTTTVMVGAAETWTKGRDRRKQLAAELLMARIVSVLLLLHLAEAVVWAVFFRLGAGLPDFESAVYFSLTSYTTVGYGDVVLAGPWRLLGPFESAVGVLMLGWSTGILVAVIGRIYRELIRAPGAHAERPVD